MNAVGGGDGIGSAALRGKSALAGAMREAGGGRFARWAGALLIAVPLVFFLALLWPSLNAPWTDSYTYSHGYLVLLLAAWLAVHEIRQAPLGAPRASWLGLLTLAAAAFAGLFAYLAELRLGEQLAVPLLVFGALWAAAGWRIARRFVWSIGYLLFGISFWDAINGPLRSLTTLAAGRMTGLVGIPAFIGAYEIHIPAGTFAVEGGCSGLHYVIAATALAAFYGLINYQRWQPRFVLLGAAAAVALAANWLRVFIIILDGQLTNMRGFLVTVDHYYFGWALFFVMLAPVFLLARRWGPLVQSRRGGAAPRTEKAGAVVPAKRLVVAALAFCLLAGTAALGVAANRVPAARSGGGIALPVSLDGWQRVGKWTGAARPHYVHADHTAAALYREGRRRVNVFVARYDAQRQGAELVYYANTPTGRDGDAAAARRTSVELANGARFPMLQLSVNRGADRRRLVAYTYDVGGRYATGPLTAKLYQVLGELRGRRSASVLVLSVRCGSDCAAARATLSAFARDAAPAVLRAAAQ